MHSKQNSKGFPLVQVVHLKHKRFEILKLSNFLKQHAALSTLFFLFIIQQIFYLNFMIRTLLRIHIILEVL